MTTRISCSSRVVRWPLPTVVGRLVLAAAVASVLAGCGGRGGGSGPAADGPLRGGAFGSIPGGTDCVPGGKPQTFGDVRFTNHGHVTVVLDRVALLRPHHERLIGSYAVPGKLLIGTVPWPPNYPGLPSTWKDRRPVHGFRLAPGNVFNMVLGVTATTTGRASSQGMAIYYHNPASRYMTRNRLAMIIAASKRGCS
jgi:hypothetical protein